jgi:site-specific DNA-methyltransferase (cytosine-N4-specific)
MIDILEKIDRIHPYPAKFTVNLAMEYIEKYSNKNDLVYDPFVGSGTTLLASTYLERFAYGTDINYIAILISNFKILSLKNDEIKVINSFYDSILKTSEEMIRKSNTKLVDFKTINHWFKDDIILFLSYLKEKIIEYSLGNEKIETFLNLVFSSIVTTVSNQESDTRYAAKNKEQVDIAYALNVFSKKLKTAIELKTKLKMSENHLIVSKAYLHDAKKATKVIKENSVDLIVTSPPYPNTYDYYLYHKHRMNWLGFDVNYSMEKEIGSRREFSSLKRPIENFNQDMLIILNESNKTLKDNGTIVIVMGDGRVQGQKYDAKENMLIIGENLGWKLIDYSYSNLDETSRSFQQSYRTKGKKEHILVFRKVK